MYGVSKSLTQSTQRKLRAPPVVAAAASSNRDASVVLMESGLKETIENAPSKASQVIEKDSKSTVGGGVEDVYGEDSATEDQYVTPWTFNIAR